MKVHFDFPKWAGKDENYSYVFGKLNTWIECSKHRSVAFERAQVQSVLFAGDKDWERYAGQYEALLKVASGKNKWEYVMGEVVTKQSARRLISFMARWTYERIHYIEFLNATKDA